MLKLKYGGIVNTRFNTTSCLVNTIFRKVYRNIFLLNPKQSTQSYNPEDIKYVKPDIDFNSTNIKQDILKLKR